MNKLTNYEKQQRQQAKKDDKQYTPYVNRYRIYELRKSELQQKNLSNEEYEAGIKKIIKELGI